MAEVQLDEIASSPDLSRADVAPTAPSDEVPNGSIQPNDSSGQSEHNPSVQPAVDGVRSEQGNDLSSPQQPSEQEHPPSQPSSEQLDVSRAPSVDGGLNHPTDELLAAQESPQSGHDAKQSSVGRDGLVRGYVGEIILGIGLLFLPVPLVVTLVGLVFANLQERNPYPGLADTIIENSNEKPLSNSYYYVNYSATRLVFVSSLQSTLALALVPAAMSLLYSYVSSRTLQKASRVSNAGKLPSPFQFGLLIRILEGGTLELYRYVKYLLKSKRKRVATVPVLNSAALMLGFMLVLAAAITIVDALLHVNTSTTQYDRSQPYTQNNFLPSRRLPANCSRENLSNSWLFDAACNIEPGGSGAVALFTNSTEAYLVLGNQSTTNTIKMADDGKTAIIIPRSTPPRTSFTARSYASSTSCETVTSRCKPHYCGHTYCDGCQRWCFNCTTETSGMVWPGNFYDVYRDVGSGQGLLFNYYNSPLMNSNDSLLYADDGSLWFGALFVIPPDIVSAAMTYVEAWDMYFYPGRDLVRDTYGHTYGLLRCSTDLSDATYFFDIDGNVKDTVLKPLTKNESAPFVQPTTFVNGGLDVLTSGVNLAAVSADHAGDLAGQFARLYDRTLLGLTAGILERHEPVSMFQRNSKQVAQVPKAELWTLIALSLILPVTGIWLGVVALIYCRKYGIADVKVRLGVEALVAGVFEDQAFNENATKMEELYAELRGMPTERVAVDEGGAGSKVLVAFSESAKDG